MPTWGWISLPASPQTIEIRFLFTLSDQVDLASLRAFCIGLQTPHTLPQLSRVQLVGPRVVYLAFSEHSSSQRKWCVFGYLQISSLLLFVSKYVIRYLSESGYPLTIASNLGAANAERLQSPGPIPGALNQNVSFS